MEPRPDDLLAQGVLQRSLLTLAELQSCLREVDLSRTLTDVLVERRVATREKLKQILEEERVAVGSGRFPAEVVAMLGKPDARLGRYVRLAVIGRGGGGTVWKAWDLETQRMVALKMLADPGYAPTRHAMREARIASQLAHPNIVPVFEVREDRDAFDREVHYIVMAWIDGLTLDQRSYAVDEALRIIRDAAMAAQAAHDKGIIHRDFKPGNIIVDDAGRVFVMDFGLAKPVSGLVDTATRSGLVLGTPAFMAPEQALGQNQELTAQADVYGLGATLYGILTGRAPFDAETLMEICKQVVAGDLVPPRSLRPEMPVDVERIILRAMAKDRARRYRTARELAADLDRVILGGHVLEEDEMLRIQGVAALREGRLEEAIHCFRELRPGLATARERLDVEIKGAAGVELGHLLLARGVIALLDPGPGPGPCREAEEAFLAAPDSAEAQLGAGVALILRSRFPGEEAGGLLDRALGHFTKAATSVPLRASAMHGRGIVKFYQARRSPDARKTLLRAAILDFESAVTADPAFAHALKDLGVAKLAIARADGGDAVPVAPVSEAVQHFTRALEVKPDLDSALFERGRAYLGLGRAAEAIDDWKKCMALAPARAAELEVLIAEARAKKRPSNF